MILVKKTALTVLSALLSLCVLCSCGAEKEQTVVQEISMVVTAESISELDKYPNLIYADLSGSTCYEAIEAYAAAHPQVDVKFTVNIGGVEVENAATVLSIESSRVDELKEYGRLLPKLSHVSISGDISPQEFLLLKEALTGVQLDCTISALGGSYDVNTEYLDLSEYAPDDAAAITELLSVLENVSEINLINPEGQCQWAPEDIASLKAAAPENTFFDCSFVLFGQTVSSRDEEIIYEKQHIGDSGLDEIRKVLPCLSFCKRFVLDDCDVSNEAAASLREEFPEAGVAWRIYFYGDSFLTDTDTVWTRSVDRSNSDGLNYFRDVVYLDIGHSRGLNTTEFLKYMPKLKVAIISINEVSDISSIVNCSELEYLELFTTNVSDISPLASCTKLEHLNISNNDNLTDITPIYSLPNLKRLACFISQVPQEQLDELARLMPDCVVLTEGVHPVDTGWRYYADGSIVERYELLREQIGYPGPPNPYAE